ncbi:ATPase [Croceicoccus ponticola]|uniref:ATP synthase subunit b n=1 Tax=Croceicoccus ponticola TaxID=2217664 RepID=A0A437H071_9SPHN|nr:ATPase [Croceicoccus ponticola]RVQ68942.1 ATPase [Croceicoccus ponticola]
MPQIEQLAATYSSQIFWLLLIFGLVFFVVGKGMVPKVMDTVAVRDRQISDDLAAAQSARMQADSEEEAWRMRENANRAEAQALVAKAKGEAAISRDKTLAAAQAQLDDKMAKAEARIAEAQKAAAAEIEDVASEAAASIVQRIAGIDVTLDTARMAVKEAM